MGTGNRNVDVLNELTIADIQTIFDQSAAENVRQNWPAIADALRQAGFACEPTMVFYAAATIRAETAAFNPCEEGASKLSKGRDGRAFGAYDQVALTEKGKPLIRFNPQHELRLTQSSAGNRPHLKGSYLDPDVSGENAWRDRKGLPARQPDPGSEDDGQLYKGRGYVQLTGKVNYLAAAKDLGLDLVNHPELATRPANAARILVWYLKSRSKRIKGLLEAATRSSTNYIDARALVNGRNKDGSVNGVEAFRKAYDSLEKLFQGMKLN